MGEPGIEPGYHLLPTAMPGDTFLARLCRFIALNNDATPLHYPAKQGLALPLLRIALPYLCFALPHIAVAALDHAVLCRCFAGLRSAMPLPSIAKQCRALLCLCRALPHFAFALFFLAPPLPFLASACLAMALRLIALLCLSFAHLHKAMPPRYVAVPRLCFAIHDYAFALRHLARAMPLRDFATHCLCGHCIADQRRSLNSIVMESAESGIAPLSDPLQLPVVKPLPHSGLILIRGHDGDIDR